MYGSRPYMGILYGDCIHSRLFVWSRDVEDAVPYAPSVRDGVPDAPLYRTPFPK